MPWEYQSCQMRYKKNATPSGITIKGKKISENANPRAISAGWGYSQVLSGLGERTFPVYQWQVGVTIGEIKFHLFPSRPVPLL